LKESEKETIKRKDNNIVGIKVRGGYILSVGTA
jgi:hypothetical protein